MLPQAYPGATAVLIDEFNADGFWRAANGGRSFSAVHFGPSLGESSDPYFQSDADLSGIVLGEVNARLLKGFLYFDDGREVSFHNSLVLFNAPQSCQADSGASGKLVLAPA
jgi:hypothetical protein